MLIFVLSLVVIVKFNPLLILPFEKLYSVEVNTAVILCAVDGFVNISAVSLSLCRIKYPHSSAKLVDFHPPNLFSCNMCILPRLLANKVTVTEAMSNNTFYFVILSKLQSFSEFGK